MVDAISLPVIGCGAGPACHGFVVVTPDYLGMTPSRPRFVPTVPEVGQSVTAAFADYVRSVRDGTYPAPEHDYEMEPSEKGKLRNVKPARSSDAV